jgi:hypothetical protein
VSTADRSSRMPAISSLSSRTTTRTASARCRTRTIVMTQRFSVARRRRMVSSTASTGCCALSALRWVLAALVSMRVHASCARDGVCACVRVCVCVCVCVMRTCVCVSCGGVCMHQHYAESTAAIITHRDMSNGRPGPSLSLRRLRTAWLQTVLTRSVCTSPVPQHLLMRPSLPQGCPCEEHCTNQVFSTKYRAIEVSARAQRQAQRRDGDAVAWQRCGRGRTH